MINITIIYNSDVLIEFKYNKTIVEKVKELPIKVYMPNEKCWWIPLHLLDNFIDSIRGFPYVIKQINLVKNEELAKTFKFKTTPFKHQIEGFEYGKNRERFLLGDEQGLGKTKQGIDIAVYKKLLYGFKHCLVIVGVKTLIYNWGGEIKLHSNEDFHILGEYKNKKDKVISGGTTYKITDLDDIDNLPYFLITNVESIRNKNISNKLIELIDTSEIGMIIFDEFHKVKNAQSQQGAALLKLKPITRIAMTGTPLLNNPLELFPVLNWLDIERHNFYQFRAHYAELGSFKEIIRYKNLDELNKILNSVMLRRKKKDVLDLPPKLYTTEYLEMGKEQTDIYEEIKEEIVKNIDKIELTSNPLTELIRLRQATGFTGILSTTIRESVKYDRAMQIVEDVISNDGKLIIYSQWVEMLKPLYRGVRK